MPDRRPLVMHERGPMFLFEGPDCSGKTTIAKMLLAYLKTFYPEQPITFMHQPSADNIIRKLMIDFDYFKECFPLVHADVFHYVHSELAQASKVDVLYRAMDFMGRGGVVLMDRCFPSTIVYNGMWDGRKGRYMNPATLVRRSTQLYADLADMHGFSDLVIGPDIAFFLDINVETYFLRMSNDDKKVDLNDYDATEESEISERIRRYRRTANLLEADGHHVVTIDSNGPIEEVFERVVEAIHEFMSQHQR